MKLGEGHGRGWGGAGGWKWKLNEGYCIQLLEFTDKAWNVNSIRVVKNKRYKTEKEKERGQDGNMQRSPLSSCYETELKMHCLRNAIVPLLLHRRHSSSRLFHGRW